MGDSVQSMPFTVKPIPLFDDNYAYLIVDEHNEAGIVDPADAPAVLSALEKENVNLTTVLTTHKHWDHAGGNVKMKAAMPNLCIVESEKENTEAATKRVKHGDEFKIGSLSVRTLSTPCHTSGHVLYVVSCPASNQTPVIFTGDTLFVGGCGRFFEGTPAEMHKALIEVIGSLDGQTLVYPGHEYTVANLKFATTVEPANDATKEKLAWSVQQRKDNLPTVPSTVAQEFTFNPFMRVEKSELQSAVGITDPVALMAELRTRKNSFKA
eukprot:JP436142.1.p1 GENE.JP436142.1~~JP436142.1.p1  ORF type:complete len:267 (+),score=45.02 JP436142.1:1-801(+)